MGEAKWERRSGRGEVARCKPRSAQRTPHDRTPADACGMRAGRSRRALLARSARFPPAHLHVTAVHAYPRALPEGGRVLRTPPCMAWPERRSLPARESCRCVELRARERLLPTVVVRSEGLAMLPQWVHSAPGGIVCAYI